MARVWVPTSTTRPTMVACWRWTRSRGLRVVYKDGLVCRSDWRTLPAFLRALREGREGPAREITDDDGRGVPA